MNLFWTNVWSIVVGLIIFMLVIWLIAAIVGAIFGDKIKTNIQNLTGGMNLPGGATTAYNGNNAVNNAGNGYRY